MGNPNHFRYGVLNLKVDAGIAPNYLQLGSGVFHKSPCVNIRSYKTIIIIKKSYLIKNHIIGNFPTIIN